VADHQRHLLRDTHQLPVAHAAHQPAPWHTVYGYFRRWLKAGVWVKVNAALVRQVRTQAGREPEPSTAVMDSQSVKTSEGGEARGVDVHKQTPERKRHIMVDVLDLLLMVVVHSASLQDAAGGHLVLQRLFERIKRSKFNRWCRLKLIWGPPYYASLVDTARKLFGWRLVVLRRPEGAKGFQALPHHWVVERTFGWLGRYRCLARDYEHTTESSEAIVYLASIRRTLKFTSK
jgi:putative transposase